MNPTQTFYPEIVGEGQVERLRTKAHLIALSLGHHLEWFRDYESDPRRCLVAECECGALAAVDASEIDQPPSIMGRALVEKHV